MPNPTSLIATTPKATSEDILLYIFESISIGRVLVWEQ